MGEKKVLQWFLYACSVLLVVLLSSCAKDKSSGRGPEGGITNCCGDLGTLDTRGLILYYTMDNLPDTLDGEIEIEDHSGEGNDGKFIRGKPLHPEDDSNEVWYSYSTDGIIGEALHISKWDYITIRDSSIDNEDFEFGTGDFTWSLWVKPSDTGKVNNYKNQVWFGAQQSEAQCGGGTHMWLGIHAGFDLAIWQLRAAHKHKDSLSNMRYQHTALGSEGLADDWHHIVAVKDGHNYSNVSIYIDGKEATEYRVDGIEGELARDGKVRMSEDYEFSKIDCFYLGMFPACNFSFVSTFTMDEVTVWNRPLSKSEVEMLYKTQSSKLKL